MFSWYAVRKHDGKGIILSRYAHNHGHTLLFKNTGKWKYYEKKY